MEHVIAPNAAADGVATNSVPETGGTAAAARRQTAPIICKLALPQTEPTFRYMVVSGRLSRAMGLNELVVPAGGGPVDTHKANDVVDLCHVIVRFCIRRVVVFNSRHYTQWNKLGKKHRH